MSDWRIYWSFIFEQGREVKAASPHCFNVFFAINPQSYKLFDSYIYLCLMKELFALTVISCFCWISTIQAQSYGTNLGLRFGNNKTARTIGITAQHRILKRVTIEGILETDFKHNTIAHILVERHKGFISKRFNAYIGAGLAFGTETSREQDEGNKLITTFGNKTFGVDIILGIEFTLLSYTISFDYKPNFNIAGRNEWYRGQAGFSIRKVLITGAKQNRNKRKKKRAKKKKQKAKSGKTGFQLFKKKQ